MDKINTALIGCGYWGSKLKRYIEGHGQFNLVSVCNSQSDLGRVWSDKTISAVVVATRNDSHYSIVKEALLAGKHVLCEKPLALTGWECGHLKVLANEGHLFLSVDFTYTFSEGLRQGKWLVESGMIGKVQGIELGAKQLGRFGRGSVYWLLGSHLLSILDMFVPIKEFCFWKSDLVGCQGEVETGVISFCGVDVRGEMLVSLNSIVKEFYVVVYGETGTMLYNPLNKTAVRVEAYERVKGAEDSELRRGFVVCGADESENLKHVVENFAEGIRGNVEGNVNRAVAVSGVIEELEKS